MVIPACGAGQIALLVTEAMVAEMKPGSIIIDETVDQGGNARPRGRAQSRAPRRIDCRALEYSGFDAGSRELATRELAAFHQESVQAWLDAPDLEMTSSAHAGHPGRADRPCGGAEGDDARLIRPSRRHARHAESRGGPGVQSHHHETCSPLGGGNQRRLIDG